MISRKLVTKVVKMGLSKTFGSAFGFGSWTIGATSIEMVIDPPIDMTTDEGKKEYSSIEQNMAKMCRKALAQDVQRAREDDRELNASLVKREMLVESTTEK